MTLASLFAGRTTPGDSSFFERELLEDDLEFLDDPIFEDGRMSMKRSRWLVNHKMTSERSEKVMAGTIWKGYMAHWLGHFDGS